MDGELKKESTISILETVQEEGNRNITRKIEFYNLDAIISVGYRINSAKATQFRIWATKTLKEFITKGYWKNSPDGRILKSDVLVAKNYLQENQIRRLERAITGYFDYIEDLVENENTFTMQQLAESVNEFLHFRKFKILQDKGKVSKAKAEQKATEEYDEFNKTQKIISDFDRHIAKLQKGR
jgi:hypothetical protein